MRLISNENEGDQSQVLLQPPKTQEKPNTLLVDSLLFVDFTKDEHLSSYQDQFNERLTRYEKKTARVIPVMKPRRSKKFTITK